MIPLHFLDAGQTAIVMDVVAPSDTVHRLHEMGLRKGVEVEVIASGSPCIVRLGEQRLCLRGDDLLHVLVQPGVVA